MKKRLAYSIGACCFNSLWQNLSPECGRLGWSGPRGTREGPVVLLGQWRYLSLPALSQPPWATITACSFMSGWDRNFWLLRGLHACCMGCCGADVGVSDYVSWSTGLPNQKQDKWKSSKQSCCQENSFQHLSKDSVDYPASCSLGAAVLRCVILLWYI